MQTAESGSDLTSNAIIAALPGRQVVIRGISAIASGRRQSRAIEVLLGAGPISRGRKMPTSQELLSLTTKVVAAYASKNTVAPSDIADLIASVHSSLASAGQKPIAAELTPAIPIKKSVAGGHIICLEDGRKYAMLKSHLRKSHNLSPDEYRERWRLPANYPMTAPDYVALRSRLAKTAGLGTRGKKGRKT